MMRKSTEQVDEDGVFTGSKRRNIGKCVALQLQLCAFTTFTKMLTDRAEVLRARGVDIIVKVVNEAVRIRGFVRCPAVSLLLCRSSV